MTACLRKNTARGLMFTLLLILPCIVTAASFSCAGVTSPDEIAICADQGLSEKDVRMATTYHLLQQLVLMGAHGALQDEQAAWLHKRRQCGNNTVCLSYLYDSRLDMLNSQYQQITSSLNR